MFRRTSHMLMLLTAVSLFLLSAQLAGSPTLASMVSISAQSGVASSGHIIESMPSKSMTTDEVDSPATLPTGLYQPIGEIVVPSGDPYGIVTRAVEEKNGYAYLLTRDGLLYSYNVSDLPTKTSFTAYKSPISSLQLPNGNGLLRNGDYLYAFGYGGLSILNIQNPASPTLLASRSGFAIYNLVKYNDYLIAPGHGGVAIYSISDPASPTLLSIYYIPGRSVFSAAAYGNVLYTYEFEVDNYSTYWLRVFDFSNPSALSLIRVITRNSLGYHLRTVGTKLIECGDHIMVGLWSLDIPTNPVFQTSQLSDARACALDGNKIVANGKVFRPNGNILELIDTFAASYSQSDGFPYGSAVTSGFVFIAQSPRILILKKGNPIVGDARLDVGMPYDANRGCSSPYSGCGGPYHGFYKGVCTDLVLDAYNAGGPFNIQSALFQDYLINRGRYRYATARNAEDMRRYFYNNQQFLSSSQPYQPGDVGFFDWNGDGITDHVLVISTLDSNGRPLNTIDASGAYSGNLSGLAFEHSWSSYYDQHIQGHGRVTGLAAPSTAALADVLQALQVSVDSPFVKLRLLDANGKSVSETYNENLVASNVESFIPYIPGGTYTDLGTAHIVTVTQPLSDTAQYVIELHGQAATTYHLLIETLQDSVVSGSRLFTPTIGVGDTYAVSLTISALEGGLQLTTTSPTLAPAPSLPDSVTLTGLVDTSAQNTFTVAELGGQQASSGIAVNATDLSDQSGGSFPASRITITPSHFTTAAGATQVVTITADISGIQPGLYLGGLVVTSQNAGTRRVPLTLSIEPHHLFLPLIGR